MNQMMICKNCQQSIHEEFDVCTVCKSNIHKTCSNKCLSCSAILCDECSLKNKFLCDSCTPIQTQTKRFDFIRRSHLELYRTCPYAFYLECVKKIPTVNNVYAESGIIIHDIIDKYTVDKNIHNEDWMINNFKEKYYKLKEHKDFIEKPELYDKLYQVGINSIKNFIIVNETMPSPIDTEKELFFDIGKEYPQVRITSDRINPIDGGIEIVDYKTGKVYSGQKLANDLQISTYIIAAERHYKAPVLSFRFLFLNENKTRDYERISDTEFACKVRKNIYIVDLNKHVEEIKTIFTNIQNNNFTIPNNIPEFHCNNFCYFGKEKICSGMELERWKLSNDPKY